MEKKNTTRGLTKMEVHYKKGWDALTFFGLDHLTLDRIPSSLTQPEGIQ